MAYSRSSKMVLSIAVIGAIIAALTFAPMSITGQKKPHRHLPPRSPSVARIVGPGTVPLNVQTL